jgi:hypothetical protein
MLALCVLNAPFSLNRPSPLCKSKSSVRIFKIGFARAFRGSDNFK